MRVRVRVRVQKLAVRVRALHITILVRCGCGPKSPHTKGLTLTTYRDSLVSVVSISAVSTLVRFTNHTKYGNSLI